MKDNLEYRVERERNAQLEAVAMMIKRRIMGYIQRKKYLKIRDDVIKIQKNYKVLYKLSAQSYPNRTLLNVQFSFPPIEISL